MNQIWTEKFRPASLSEIVGQDENVDKLKGFVKRKDIPHLIFSGSAGTGKTSAAIALAIELFGENWKENFLELNASNNRGINVIRGHEDREGKDTGMVSVKDYARLKPSNPLGFKIIFLDEADQLTGDAQAALRRTMEVYSSSTRFILSCNYSSQIIPPIQSRCVLMRFRSLDDNAIRTRISLIAVKENINLSEAVVEAIIDVAEEGLDIPATDLVIFYEPVPSDIRTIQRRGRTGRSHAGEVHILTYEGSRDIGYLFSARRKENQMKSNIAKLRDEIKKAPSTLYDYFS